MPKGSSKKPKREDAAQSAVRVMQELAAKSEADAKPEEPTTITDEMRAAAAAFGRIGGRIGGKRRAESLTPERRAEIARAAAQSRWKPKT